MCMHYATLALSIGVAMVGNKKDYCDSRGLSLDLKHTGASFLLNSIDFLCL